MTSPRPSWTAAVVRHRVAVLVVALLVTAAATWRASRLKLDSDLRTLMPAGHPVIAQLHRVEQALGHLGALYVVVEGGTLAGRRALADALATTLADDPMIDTVEHRIDASFIHDHALFYLDDEAMLELREHVDAWQHHELCSRAPDLCLTEPDADAPERLEQLLREHEARLHERTGPRDYFEDPAIEALVVFVYPDRPSSDVEFDLAVTDHVRRTLWTLEAQPGPWGEAPLRTAVVGPYAAKADETRSIRRDVVRSGAAAAIGVALVLLIVFRSGRALFALLVPLGVGVAWSLAAAELMLGHLSVMTSLISAVIMGLGIDAGIHLMTRCRHERRSHPLHDAIVRAFGHLRRPVLLATGTTTCAFVALATSGFPGFRELGLVAAAGVTLCTVSMLTVYPALLAVVGLDPAEAPSPRWAQLGRPGRRRLRLTAVAVATGIAVLLAARMTGDAFERSSRRLQSDRIRQEHEPALATMVSILGRQVHTGVLVLDDYPTMAQAYRRAREQHRARRSRGASVVAELVAAPDLMPPPDVDLARRHAEIAEFAESLSDRTWARLHGTAPDDATIEPDVAASLRRMLQAEPFGPDDLPLSLTRRLRGRDGSWAIHAHPDFDPADMIEGIAFIEETALYAPPDGKGLFVGETILYASMILEMKAEWPRVFGLTVGLVFVFAIIQLRSLRRTAATLMPAAVGLLWLLGLMSITGLRFSLFNLAVIPIIVGIGVDDGVYLRACLDADPDERATELGHGVRAVLASTATTMVGFGAFGLADSAGLRGIGELATLGILLTTIAALLIVGGRSRIDARSSSKTFA